MTTLPPSPGALTTGNELDQKLVRGRVRYERSNLPATGSVIFHRSGGVLRDTSQHEFLVPETVGPITLSPMAVGQPETGGEFAVSLTVNDDPDVQPRDTQWTAEFFVDGATAEQFPPVVFVVSINDPDTIWLDLKITLPPGEPGYGFVLEGSPRLLPTGGAVGQVLGRTGVLDFEVGWIDAGTGTGTGVHDHNGVYQPLDADLTALAALATTSFGRALLEQGTAGAVRSYLGLGSAALSAATAFDAAGAAATVQANLNIVSSNLAAVDAAKLARINGLYVIDAGGNPNTARPGGIGAGYWVNSPSRPTNIATNDIWYDPAAVVDVMWNPNDWARFSTTHVMTQDTLAAWTKTVQMDAETEAKRARVANTTGTGTQGASSRIWHLLDDTSSIDSELKSLFYARSDHPSGGQMGHVHRAGVNPATGRPWGYIVWYDITLGLDHVLNLGVWTTSGTAPTVTLSILASVDTNQLDGLLYKAPVASYGKVGTTLNVGIPGEHRVQVGDTVDLVGTAIDATGMVVTGFSGAATAIMTHPVSATVSGGAGLLRDYRRVMPYFLKSRLEGNVLRAKAWREGTGEPDWGDPRFAGSFVDSGNLGPTAPGQTGLYVGHMAPGKFVEFGSVHSEAL